MIKYMDIVNLFCLKLHFISKITGSVDKSLELVTVAVDGAGRLYNQPLLKEQIKKIRNIKT